MSKYLISLSSLGKRIIDSEAVRIVAQVLFAVSIFAVLYLFLIAGFALGMEM